MNIYLYIVRVYVWICVGAWLKEEPQRCAEKFFTSVLHYPTLVGGKEHPAAALQPWALAFAFWFLATAIPESYSRMKHIRLYWGKVQHG